MLDTNYLLKQIEDGILTTEFLLESKNYFIKRNQDTQEKLNFLAIQQKNAYESVKQIISLAKKQAEDGDLFILSKVKAGQFINSYRKPFNFIYKFTSETNVIDIEFVQVNPEVIQSKHDQNYLETIDQFIEELGKTKSKILNPKEGDGAKIGRLYKTYMDSLKDDLTGDSQCLQGISEERRGQVYKEVETHIALGLYLELFPERPNRHDTLFRCKALLLQWIDPVTFGIREEDLRIDYWRSACEDIERMEAARTPAEKLEHLVHCLNVIMQGMMKFSQRSEPPGADDLTPLFNYVMIMSAPKMIYSNLEYSPCSPIVT